MVRKILIRGADRIRTGDEGFADPRLRPLGYGTVYCTQRLYLQKTKTAKKLFKV